MLRNSFHSTDSWRGACGLFQTLLSRLEGADTTIWRAASVQPDATVYSGPSSSGRKRMTLRTLLSKYRRKEPITMVTAYDYPSAVHVEQAGIDALLVGDSVGMVVHGHDTTLPVTLDEMLMHCRAVARGAKNPFLIGDLPFGSYEISQEQAIISAMKLVKEGGMDGIKLEGASSRRVDAVKAIVDAGIAVMGHVGLTPQMIGVLGGFRPQGLVATGAIRIVEQAMALRDAGCFALVLECVPSCVGAAVTSAVDIPVIGIGAGPETDGQVLVYHDLLGFTQHPHHAKVTPKFCKQFGQVGKNIQDALGKYKQEVDSRDFPGTQFSPYKINPKEVEEFTRGLQKAGLGHIQTSTSTQALNETEPEKKL